MALEPYALSVHHFISSVGADAGFASIIGLAVLVLLYFAQARETASLRDQAELAAQRVAQLESRLAHAAAAAPPPTAAPMPGVQPPPRAFPGQLGQPAPAPAAVNPLPPAGVAAPPLSAATKLIPTPSPAGLAALAAARAATGRSPMAPTPAVPAPTAAAGATSALAGAAPANPPVASPPGSPPPMNEVVTPRPATAAGGATATNGTGEHPVIPPPVAIPPRPPVQIRAGGTDRMLAELSGDGGSSPSDLTRVLTALAAVAVVAAIVIVLLSVTSGGGSPHSTPQTKPPVSNALTTTTTQHHAAAKAAAVNPASVTVSVLNGTAVYHLADSIATQLGADGFKQGTVTNAATQTQPSTTVEYAPGDQRDAAAVAKVLKLSTSAVQPITSDTQALGCPQAGSCSVVVTVGADLATTSTQTQTTP